MPPRVFVTQLPFFTRHVRRGRLIVLVLGTLRQGGGATLEKRGGRILLLIHSAVTVNSVGLGKLYQPVVNSFSGENSHVDTNDKGQSGCTVKTAGTGRLERIMNSWFSPNRFLLPFVAVALSAAPASGQQPASDEPQDPGANSVLKVVPRELIQQGLKPLSAELPDTKVRSGLLPPDASEGFFDKKEARTTTIRGGNWAPIHYHWLASDLTHRPLYFEDAALERYGQTRRPLLQPFVSGARFFMTFPVLPYAAGVNPPRPAISTLGYYRPGNNIPLLLQRPPLDVKAGLLQAGSSVGMIFVIP